MAKKVLIPAGQVRRLLEEEKKNAQKRFEAGASIEEIAREFTGGMHSDINRVLRKVGQKGIPLLAGPDPLWPKKSAGGGRPKEVSAEHDGAKVRALRLESDTKASDFCNWYHVSQNTLLYLERDGRATTKTIKAVCKGLTKRLERKVTPEDLKKNRRK